MPLARVMAGLGAQTSELVLGIEDGVESSDGLQRDRRDLLGHRSALAGRGLDVGQFEELAPGM